MPARRAVPVAGAIALSIVTASHVQVQALHRDALAPIVTQFTSGLYTLQVDLHEPDLKGDSMQAPTLEMAGWHHHNPAGAVAIAKGSRVEVTGVFNYAERGLFMELSKDSAEGGEPAEDRPRIRIRIMVEAEAGEPEKQRAEALALIHKVLSVP